MCDRTCSSVDIQGSRYDTKEDSGYDGGLDRFNSNSEILQRGVCQAMKAPDDWYPWQSRHGHVIVKIDP
jgi:hypothetical protein